MSDNYIEQLTKNGLTQEQADKFASAVSEADLALLSNDADLSAVLSELGIKPNALNTIKLRKFAESQASSTAPTSTMPNSPTPGYPAGQPMMTVEYIGTLSGSQLLQHYDPDNHDNLVGNRLAEVSKGQAFLIFTDEGTVNLDASQKLLKELKDGHQPRDIYGGRNVFPVGSKPGQTLDENPLYPGETLRPDGTCDRTQMQWTCDSELRIIARLAVNTTNELSARNLKEAKDIVMMAHRDGGKELRSYCPKAVRKLADLKEEGNAPSLKIKRQGQAQSTGFGNNPLAVNTSGHQRY